jgi:hypothetical protein
MAFDEDTMLHYDTDIPKNIVELAKFIADAPRQYDIRYAGVRRPRTIGVYYASGAWMCIRRHYWEFFDETTRSPDNPDDMALFRYAAAGNMHHDHIEDAFKWMQEQQKKSKPTKFNIDEYRAEMRMHLAIDFEKDIWISGRIDHLLVFPELSMVVEVKSRDNVDKMRAPTTHHVPQLQLYMKSHHAKYGMFIYSSRRDLQTRAFLIKQDPSLIKTLFRRLTHLDSCIRSRMLPPPESKEPMTSRAWECNKFCKYKDKCDEVEGLKQKKLDDS